MSATVFFQSADEIATLTNVFEINGVPTDPTTVTLTITDPTGATSSPTVTRTSTGTYTAGIACTAAGMWTFLWEGTGSASDAIAGTWTVQPVALNKYYCSAEELKSRLQIATTADDFELIQAVQAASRAIDGYCERFFFRSAETRTYVPDDLYRCRVDDLVSVTTLGTDPGGTTAQGGTFPVTWATSDFQLLPYNPGKLGEPWPYTSIRAVGHFTFPWVTPLLLMRMDRVQVTGVFGWPAIPQAVHLAALIAAGELFRMKDMPVGGAVPGEFTITDLGPSAASQIGRLLGPYCRNPVLAA